MEQLSLAWGGHYAMVEPSSFRVDYVINPFMDPAHQPDPVRAHDQWQELAEVLRALGARVDEIPAMPAAPDAPCGWPICDFVALMGVLAARSPSAIFTAAVSRGSLSCVPVPCRFTCRASPSGSSWELTCRPLSPVTFNNCLRVSCMPSRRALASPAAARARSSRTT